MPTSRPNEDRYTSKYQDYGDSRGRGLPVDERKKSVIEKLTAPPETVIEHLDRIGVGYRLHDSLTKITIDLDDLGKAEGRE